MSLSVCSKATNTPSCLEAQSASLLGMERRERVEQPGSIQTQCSAGLEATSQAHKNPRQYEEATFQHRGPMSTLGSKHPNAKHTRHSPTQTGCTELGVPLPPINKVGQFRGEFLARPGSWAGPTASPAGMRKPQGLPAAFWRPRLWPSKALPRAEPLKTGCPWPLLFLSQDF